MNEKSSKIEAIFAEAVCETDPDRRALYLSKACGDDTGLRRRVEALLAADAAAGHFMKPSEAMSSAPTIDEASAGEHPGTPGLSTGGKPAALGRQITEQPGSIIGPYKILQQIGEGGFGVVYMAEQEKPIRRRVALKVIKAGMDTKAVIARFEAERQALAMMDHPNIARVLDAGATDTGRPFFVMELVKGIPITDYCDDANLDMRQRLELFMDVCRAVQHAHQKGVIHRDLKPSNIMVTLHDAKPVVKVIDFGIAKATDQKLTEKTLFTNYGQMIGTPTYMSPEQATISALDVDTRSDVYSLGVLLYELLTGAPPFDALSLRSAGFDEMRRIIREQQPPKPSTKLTTLDEAIRQTVATRRQASPQALSRQIRGDLDWIVLKAIEKDRSRRYESASAFAQDIERHLRSEPVVAGAPSTIYRLRKFVVRNKAPMVAAATMVLLLLAGTAVSTWQAIRATRAQAVAVAAVAEKEKALAAEAEQRRQAEASRKSAVDAANVALEANAKAQKRLAQIQKANNILGSIFESLDPAEIATSGRPLQAILVEKLDQAVEQIEGESIGDPVVVAEMQYKFGKSLIGLGEPQKAVTLLRKALATSQAALGAEHPATLMTMNVLALGYHDIGRLDLSEQLLERALAVWKSTGGPASQATLMGMNNLAEVYSQTGKRDRAIPLFEESLRLSRLFNGPDDVGTLTAMNNLGTTYLQNGEGPRALPLLDEAVRIAKQKYGPTHPSTLSAMNNLAGACVDTSQLDRAIQLYEAVAEQEKKTLGSDHLSALTTLNNLATAYRHAGKVDLAISLHQQTLKATGAKLGPDHPRTVACLDGLAHAYIAAGKLDLGVPLMEQVLKQERVVYGPDDQSTLSTQETLAGVYRDGRRFPESIALFEDALQRKTKMLGPNHIKRLASVNNLAGAYKAAGQLDKALPLYEEAIKLRREYFGDDHVETIITMDEMAGLFWMQNRLDRSIPLCEEALRRSRAVRGNDNEETLRIAASLGVNYKTAGRTDEALKLLEEACGQADKYPILAGFRIHLLDCYVMLKKNDKAPPLSRKVLEEQRKLQPADSPKLAWKLAIVGRAMLREKAFADAEPIFRECLEIRKKALPDDWTTFNTQSLLGSALLGQKKYDEAEPLLVSGYEGMKQREKRIPPQAPHLTEAIERLVDLYRERAANDSDAEKLAVYRKLLESRQSTTSPAVDPPK